MTTTSRIPAALALLREKGWCKDRYDNEGGARCILGALYAVHEEAGFRMGALSDIVAVATVVRDEYGTDRLADFNDDPETTFADVERVMEKAALARGAAL